MLNIPVYSRNGIYYLHTRINQQQIKRSLNTKDANIAIIRALELLKVIDMAIDPNKIKKYEIDLGRGVFKSNGAEDHKNMLEALSNIDKIGVFKKTQSPPAPEGEPLKSLTGLRLLEFLEKFFNLKKNLRPATVMSYKNTVNEFAGFTSNQFITDYDDSDITRYMEHLATFNEPRTIDGKIGTLTTVFNLAIRQGYYFKENPASGRRLLTKRERAKNGYSFFEHEEIQELFKPEYLEIFKSRDPDFYYCILLVLLTGARSSEISSLKPSQLKENPPHLKIRDSKTVAGIRNVPIPEFLLLELKAFGTGKTKLFKYKELEGKGSGNAVGKKFTRHMNFLNMRRNKLVFHSLRKFFNDYMKDEKVPIEARCQVVGHEFDNVNVTTYTQDYTITELRELVTPVQAKILKLIKYY
jgi:integrase